MPQAAPSRSSVRKPTTAYEAFETSVERPSLCSIQTAMAVTRNSPMTRMSAVHSTRVHVLMWSSGSVPPAMPDAHVDGRRHPRLREQDERRCTEPRTC